MFNLSLSNHIISTLVTHCILIIVGNTGSELYTVKYVLKTTRVWDLFLEIQKIIFDASISLFWWFDFWNWKYFETCLTFEQKISLSDHSRLLFNVSLTLKVLFIFSNSFPTTVLYHMKTDYHAVKGIIIVAVDILWAPAS